MFFSHNTLLNIWLKIDTLGQDKAILLCYAFTNSRFKIKKKKKKKKKKKIEFCADWYTGHFDAHLIIWMKK